MYYFRRYCCPLLLVTFLMGCGGSENSGSADPSGNSANPIGNYDPTSYVPEEILVNNYGFFGRREFGKSIQSDITGVSYGYEVYLPPEYDLEPDRSFPVLYVTDAQFDVTFHAKMLDFAAFTPVIMVGIDEGPIGRRATDYILPGAQTYFRFFTEEFIPAVESEYRIIASDRTFEGSSAGGQASLVMMALDDENPPIFKAHFAFDPWQPSNVDTLLRERRDTGVPLNKIVFVSSASGGFESTVKPFVQDLRNLNIEGLTIYERSYDVGHTDATWASLFTALASVYELEN